MKDFNIKKNSLIVLMLTILVLFWILKDNLPEVIVDIVETGSTLKENGLEVLEEITNLSARVVVNQVSLRMEHERINKLLTDLKSVL